MKLSSKIQRCELSPVRKFYPVERAAVERGIRVHHMNIGQPDIETPPVFFQTIRDFPQKVIEYAPAPGMEVFVRSARKYYGQLGVALEEDDILTTFGGSEALEVVMASILEDGDEILVPEPFYPNYTTFVNITGARIRPVPTSAADGYHYARRELLEPLINEHTRAILITNPGNPTGAVLTDEEARFLADFVKEHHLFLISDEVYREIVYTNKPSTMLAFADAAENIAVVDSVSKRFSCTGARVGMLVSRNRELINEALKICQGRLCAATLDQLGAAAMFDQLGPDYHKAVLAEYTRRREAIVTALKKLPGVQFSDPEGAFYFMATLPVDDVEQLQYFLLEEFEDRGETVMVTPGAGFYSDPDMGRNMARIAYVTAPEDLERSVELLGLGMEAYNRKRKGN